MIKNYEEIRDVVSHWGFEESNKAFSIFRDLVKEVSITTLERMVDPKDNRQDSTIDNHNGELVVSLPFGETGYYVEKGFKAIVSQAVSDAIETNSIEHRANEYDMLKVLSANLKELSGIVDAAISKEEARSASK